MSLEQRYIQSKYKSMITDNTPEPERIDITEEKAAQRMTQETIETLNQGFEEGAEFYERMSRSALASVLGTPGETERLVKGGSEAIQRTFGMPMLMLGRELSKSAGNEELAQTFDSIMQDKNKMTAFESLLDQFSQDSVLPNIKDIKDFMTENFDFEFEDDIPELIAEIAAPTGVITKFLQNIYKAVKPSAKPIATKLEESKI